MQPQRMRNGTERPGADANAGRGSVLIAMAYSRFMCSLTSVGNWNWKTYCNGTDASNDRKDGPKLNMPCVRGASVPGHRHSPP